MRLRSLGVIAICITALATTFCLILAVIFPWPASVPGMIGAAVNGGLLIVNVWRYLRNERIGLHR